MDAQEELETWRWFGENFDPLGDLLAYCVRRGNAHYAVKMRKRDGDGFRIFYALSLLMAIAKAKAFDEQPLRPREEFGPLLGAPKGKVEMELQRLPVDEQGEDMV